MSLLPNESITVLLEALGYVETDAEHLAFVGNYFTVLTRGSTMIDDENMQLKMLFMPEEERKKQ